MGPACCGSHGPKPFPEESGGDPAKVGHLTMMTCTRGLPARCFLAYDAVELSGRPGTHGHGTTRTPRRVGRAPGGAEPGERRLRLRSPPSQPCREPEPFYAQPLGGDHLRPRFATTFLRPLTTAREYDDLRPRRAGPTRRDPVGGHRGRAARPRARGRGAAAHGRSHHPRRGPAAPRTARPSPRPAAARRKARGGRAVLARRAGGAAGGAARAARARGLRRPRGGGRG